MSYEALARRCMPNEGSALRTPSASYPGEAALTARVGADPAPLRPTPTLTTKADVDNYARDLKGLISSFSKDDVVAHMVIMDPNVEADRVVYFCQQAQAQDGCDQCLTCPGWQESEPAPAATDYKATLARQLRQQAFQHRVNQRWMEDQIDARSLKKAQWQAEVAYYAEWQNYLKRFDTALTAIDNSLYVKESDFQQIQHLDVEFQQFRQRYTALTGLQPTKPLSLQLPPERTPYLDTITAVAYAAVAVGGIYLLYKVVGTKVTVAAQQPAGLIPAHA